MFIDGEQTILSGTEQDTTHNRMELTAVIKAIEYIRQHYNKTAIIRIISDSQYVIGLTGRKDKLAAKDFITKKGNDIRNADLVKQFLELAAAASITLTKIKAHQKETDTANYNIEADKLARNILRNIIDQR